MSMKIRWMTRERMLRFPAEVLRRFPVGMAAALLAWVAVMGFIWDWWENVEWSAEIQRIFFLFPFALFGNVGWILHCERRGFSVKARRCGFVALALLCAGGWFCFPPAHLHSPNGFLAAYSCAVVALATGVAVLMTARRGAPGLRESLWGLTVAIFMAHTFAAILALGFGLACGSLQMLFGLSHVWMEKWIPTCLVSALFLVAPCIGFAWLPRPGEKTAQLPAWVQTICRTLLLPLCALYSLILLAYFVKIAIQTHWPDGWVSMPILIFSGIGWLAWIFLRETDGGEEAPDAPSRRFCRALPAVLLVLAGVMFLALSVRLNAYGITVARAAGLYAGIWLAVAAIFYLVRPTASARHLALSLCVTALLATAGPISLNALTVRSQRPRLTAALAAFEAAATTENARSDATQEAEREARNVSEYLLDYYGIAGLPPALATRWKDAWTAKQPVPSTAHFDDYLKKHAWHLVDSFWQDLDLPTVESHPHKRPINHVKILKLADNGTPLTGWNRVWADTDTLPWKFSHQNGPVTDDGSGDPLVSADWASYQEKVRQRVAETTTENLQPIADNLQLIPLPLDVMMFTFSHNGRTYAILFKEIQLNNDGSFCMTKMVCILEA